MTHKREGSNADNKKKEKHIEIKRRCWDGVGGKHLDCTQIQSKDILMVWVPERAKKEIKRGL